MTGSTPISTGATVPGANPVSQAQTQTPVAQKSESTWAIWKNSFFGKDAGFFKRTVCTIAAAVSYLPARVYSYFTGKGLLARMVTQPQAPVQKQMPSANVSQTPASPVSSEVESLKAQLAATVEGEKNKQAEIEHLVEEQEHKLESQKYQFMAQINEKDCYIQSLDKLLVEEHDELEKTKAKCAEHKKSEEVARDTLVKYLRVCADNERQIKELKEKVSELTNDCQNLMLQNPKTKAVVDRLKKDHKDEIDHLVAELRVARDVSGRLSPTQTYTFGMQAGDIYDTSLHSVDGRPLPASISPAPSDARAELVRVVEEAMHFVHRRVGAPVIPQNSRPSVTSS